MKRLGALAVAAALVLSGCASGSATDRTTLTVLAGTSLTDVFGELGTAYRQTHRGVIVRFSFAGSQELALRVRDGVRADVLVTADEQTMNELAEYTAGRRIIAHNTLAIAVTPGNPKKIKGLADLAKPKLRVVIAAPGVPVGRYARQALAKAGVALLPRSQEVDARSVLTRVRTGEADAGIVYATDIASAGAAVSGVSIPVEHNVFATYPAATLSDSEHADVAETFVAWLGSVAARSTLQEYGFTT